MNEKFNELSEMVFGCENLLKLFNKNDYATAFNDYFKKYRKVFDSLEEEYNSSEDKEGLINGVADKFIDFAKEQCNAGRKYTVKSEL